MGNRSDDRIGLIREIREIRGQTRPSRPPSLDRPTASRAMPTRQENPAGHIEDIVEANDCSVEVEP